MKYWQDIDKVLNCLGEATSEIILHAFSFYTFMLSFPNFL